MLRFFNFVFALILLVLFAPLLLFIYISVAMTSDGPALFKQRRIGRDNKEFYIYKFRTMRTDAPTLATNEFHNVDEYITNIGRILRKSSLDELPQLYNILKGEMAFIGPRPLIAEETEILKMRTLCGVSQLMPGLTGWAQINGRDNLNNEEKVRLDYIYAQKKGILFDLKILFLTIIKVLGQDDIREVNPTEIVRNEFIEREYDRILSETSHLIKIKQAT